MSHTKLERDKQKLIQDKCQQILTELLRDEDNKYCVDCDSKGPRWASWNLGIFLCIRCAGIHRNLGVHISKVKSVNLDSWTPEQVGSIQNMGNSKARAVYEANLPDNFSRPQADTALETFIRSKYEHKKYIAKEWVETQPKPAFDVETELKKEKEKKKNKIKPIAPISTQTEIQSNPIPRPTANVINGGKSEKGPTTATAAAATTTTTTATTTNQQKTESNQSASADLLSLDLSGGSGGNGSNEAFGSFFSSPQPTTTNNKNNGNPVQQIQPTNNNNNNKTLDDEEKDFFSQKTLDKKDEKKFTKESILSLYSQAPINQSTAINGFPSHNMVAMPMNHQFTNVNPLFNTVNPTNPMASTNPFLANSNPLMAAGDKPGQNLVQGLSSMNLQSNQIPIGGGGGGGTSRNPAASNTHSHLNWFQTPPQPPCSSGPSNLNATNSGSLSVANPFMEQQPATGKNLLNILDSQSNNGNNNILSAVAVLGGGGDLISSSSSSTTTSTTTANNPLDKINDNFNFW